MATDPENAAPPHTLAARVLEVGGRLAEGPSARLVETVFRRELEAQLGLFDAMSRVDLAHTAMLIEGGVIPAEPGRQLLQALLELHRCPDDFHPEPERGDLYTNREAWLASRTDATGWLGAGRARREATTTAFLMRVRGELLELADALLATCSILTERARGSQDALMADYTYLLAAQPTSFGHYLLGFAYPMLRDLERLRALYARVNRSPAGCGSTNGSRLFQDRERLAEWLGFDGLVSHARDAMWEADLPIEAAAMLTAVLVNLDRLAEDLQIFSTEEFGLVALDDRHARASKVMPQKKNPFALTHVRGLASGMLGDLVATAATARTPSGQPDNRLPVYGTLPRALEDTRGAVELMGEVIQCLGFERVRARARLEHGSAFATDLAEALTLECRVDFRAAHRLVGRLVRTHSETDGFRGMTVGRLVAAAEEWLGQTIDLPEAALDAVMDPSRALAARTGTGGAAAEPMRAMIAECGQALDESRTWIGGCRGRLTAADAALLDKARRAAGQ